MVRKLMGGLLVSIVILWFADFEGWAGKQINRKGSLNLHWATFGIPKMKEHKESSFLSVFWIQDTLHCFPERGITWYL